ncbi:MAG: GatB/YqeY domain-containing protein, partial [bacterium]|nr:GatB/YqeY domain-containing protein [bacterium]
PVLKDEDVIAIIKRSVKQRKDSIEQFEKGGRSDLADKEKAELKILEEFLPASMGRDEIRKVVQAKLESEGPLDKTKMGQFMGTIMKELKGKADGSDVKAVIDEVVKG